MKIIQAAAPTGVSDYRVVLSGQREVLLNSKEFAHLEAADARLAANSDTFDLIERLAGDRFKGDAASVFAKIEQIAREARKAP